MTVSYYEAIAFYGLIFTHLRTYTVVVLDVPPNNVINSWYYNVHAHTCMLTSLSINYILG